MVGGSRYPANMGGRVDVESPAYVIQCKERSRCSLAELEALALEIERIGAQKTVPKHGLVMVKRSAGRGIKTPWLIVMTEATFREMNGRLPIEPAGGAH